MLSIGAKVIVGVVLNQHIRVVIGVEAPGDEHLALVVEADHALRFLPGA
jgi:mannitol/fructose-specific phosphotransferase system IIA component